MRPRILALLLVLGLTAAARLAAVEPADLQRVLDVIGREEPKAVVLEIELDSGWDGGLVSVQTDTGHEYYIRLHGGRIEERERERADWEDRQVARDIAGGASFLGLVEAYARVLEEMRSSGAYDGVSSAHFRSIEYEVEYRRPAIEVDFDVSGDTLSVYVDPETGEIIMSEWDE